MTGVEAAKALPGTRAARPAEAGANRAVQSFASIFEAARQQNRPAEAGSSRADRIAEMDRRREDRQREPAPDVEPSSREKRIEERRKSARVDRLKSDHESSPSGQRAHAEGDAPEPDHLRQSPDGREVQDQRRGREERPTPARPGSHADDTNSEPQPVTENDPFGQTQPAPVVGLAPIFSAPPAGGSTDSADASGPTLPLPAPGPEPLQNGLAPFAGARGTWTSSAVAASGAAEGAEPATSPAVAVQATPGATGETHSRGTGDSTEFLSSLQAANARRSARVARPAQPATANSTQSDAPATLRLDSPKAMEELAAVVRARAAGRHPSLTIQLDPPELGKMRVDVRMHDQTMIVRFQAQTETGHDALSARLGDLRDALDGQGIRLDRLEVEFRPPPPPNAPSEDQQNPQQHGAAQWQGSTFEGRRQEGAGQEGQPATAGGFEAGDYPAGDMPADERDYVGRLAESGVDLRV